MLKLYTKTVCPKCVVAKAMLNGNNIEFEAINLDQDEDAKQKLKELGFMAAPIAEYNDKFYILPNQSDELLDDLK
jgi:glutaredoxin